MKISEVLEYPEISFTDNVTLEEIRTKMINDYQDMYFQQTGEKVILSLSDPNRLILYSCALQIYQSMQFIEQAGKQNLLTYAYGSYLDNLGALKRITRSQGSPSLSIVKFTLSRFQQNVITIPEGTRVTAGDDIYFYTTETKEIAIGDLYTDVPVKCTEIGIKTNEYDIGSINILVDPIPFISSVSNIVKCYGGSDIESDDSLAERIFLAPSSYSTAGPDDAYTYWIKTLNSNVIDVKVTSPSAVTVDIRFLLSNGELPSEDVINSMQQLLSDKTIRPLTDNVIVNAPNTVDYSINAEYFIFESDRKQAAAIQQKVNEAVNEYILWQKTKIGRDINPSMLMKKMVTAGAKRVEISAPIFKSISEISVANLIESTVIYGGIESD